MCLLSSAQRCDAAFSLVFIILHFISITHLCFVLLILLPYIFLNCICVDVPHLLSLQEPFYPQRLWWWWWHDQFRGHFLTSHQVETDGILCVLSAGAPVFPSLHQLTSMSFTAATSTVAVTTSKSSSHVTRCSDSQRNYCVNGGECFTLEIMPGSTKFLCRYDMDSGVYVTTLQLICLKDTVDGIMLDDIVTDSQPFKLCFALCLHIRCVEQIQCVKSTMFHGLLRFPVWITAINTHSFRIFLEVIQIESWMSESKKKKKVTQDKDPNFLWIYFIKHLLLRTTKLEKPLGWEVKAVEAGRKIQNIAHKQSQSLLSSAL